MRPLFFTLLFFLTSLEAAFTLYPISHDFEPKGIHSTKLFYIKNGGERPIAVQITVLKRDHDINGVEVRDEEEGEENFFVYPPQMVVPPEREQVVRVQWLGDPEVEVEEAYRIIAEEVPVKFQKKQEDGEEPEEVVSGVEFIFTYEGALYVGDESFDSNVSLVDAKHVKEDGEDFLEVVFENTGRKHQVMQDLQGWVTSKGSSEVIDLPTSAFVGSLNILAKKKRRYLIPWPESLPKGEVEFNYTYFGRRQ